MSPTAQTSCRRGPAATTRLQLEQNGHAPACATKIAIAAQDMETIEN
jgi:hypothetical protein